MCLSAAVGAWGVGAIEYGGVEVAIVCCGVGLQASGAMAVWVERGVSEGF